MVNEIQNNKLQLLGKLAASLVHEIRNPLSAIRLNVEYISIDKETLTTDQIECLDSSKEAIERIQNIIENVLELSRRGAADYETHSLNDVVLSGIKIMNPFAETKSIFLKLELAHDLPHFQFNRNRVLQIIVNLITNAIEASQKGDNIKIITHLEKNGAEHKAVLSVQDVGHGIDESHQHKIFSDFFTNKSSGTGIGLSVCKSIMEEHGGEISFTSEPGTGSVFFVKFPCSPIIMEETFL